MTIKADCLRFAEHRDRQQRSELNFVWGVRGFSDIIQAEKYIQYFSFKFVEKFLILGKYLLSFSSSARPVCAPPLTSTTRCPH